jgi:hypothetical protein
MDVLVHHQHWLTTYRSFDLRQLCMKRLLLAFLRVRLSSGQRSPVGTDSNSANRGTAWPSSFCPLGEYGFQLG